MFGMGAIGQLCFGDRFFVREDREGAVDWSGNSEVEFAPTLDFIELIESGEGLISYAAEINLRSL